MKKINLFFLFFLSIISVVFAQATDPKGLCLETGGKWYSMEDCSPCPQGAVCEACFVGCQCASDSIWLDAKGCVNYDDLITQASSVNFRGIMPPQEELDAANQAMEALKTQKEKVTGWIIRSLEQQRSPQALSMNHPWGIMSYGVVLCGFGIESVLKLEPQVLESSDEEVRLNGVWILNEASWRLRESRQEIESLLQKMLKQDKSERVRQEITRILTERGWK